MPPPQEGPQFSGTRPVTHPGYHAATRRPTKHSSGSPEEATKGWDQTDGHGKGCPRLRPGPLMAADLNQLRWGKQCVLLAQKP